MVHDTLILDDLISDVQPNDLHEIISKVLNIKYLSDSAQESDDVKGILFGGYLRLIGAMTLEINGKVKNIHFLVDMRSPKTYICEEVLNSYQLSNINPETPFSVRLNKRQISVKVSHDHFNILGTDFLHTHKAQLFVDFEEHNFIIKFNTLPTQVSIDASECTPKRQGDWYQGYGRGRSQGHCPTNRQNSIMKTGELSKTVVYVANLPFSIDDDGLKDLQRL